MLHVYRQVTGIQRFRHHVVTRRREQAERFPFPCLTVLRRSPWRWVGRTFHRLRACVVPLPRYETNQLLRLTREHSADVVHIYFGTEAARMLDYLRREVRPVVVSFHGADVSDLLADDSLRGIHETATLLLARSESLRQALVARGCAPDRIVVTPTGIPPAEQPREPRLEPVTGDRPIRLLQACRLIDKKGLDISVAAVAELRRRGLPAVLDIAGDGSLRPALEGQAAAAGLSGAVRFLGFLPNTELLSRLPGYDVFLHPSRTTEGGDREGVPNSMLEAMAAGVPVIATRHSGIPEVITDGEHGLLIPSADTDALAAAILKLAREPALFADLSRNARRRVAQRHSLEGSVQILEAAYQEAIFRRGGAVRGIG
jgi:glycosyltransferase involved in cell wall biosynthesis